MKVRLCGVADVGEGEMIQATAANKPPFAVYHVDGVFYVSDDACSHGKASLSDEGELDGHCVTCTWHDGQFDIRTGEPTAAPCTQPIRVYPVKIEDEAVWIDIE